MLVHGKFGWSLSAIAKLYMVEPHRLIKTVGTCCPMGKITVPLIKLLSAFLVTRRVTLIVAFAFSLKMFERWQGPTNGTNSVIL